MKYQDGTAPVGYHCTGCGVEGVKLWRQYQTCADAVELLCCDCAAKDQDRDISDIDVDGRHTDELGHKSSQIGGLVPAIPTEDESTYWGYTSVPQLGVLWWHGLPLREGGEFSGLTGVAMLVQSAKKDLECIEQISPVTRSICGNVMDVVERLQALVEKP